MIEAIDLKNFELISNYLLIKADGNYDLIVLDGPEGKKVELQIISFSEQQANHYSISGTLIKKSKNPYFFNKKKNIPQGEFQSNVMTSTQADCDYDFTEGDKIFYNYNVQLNCEQEHRLVETKEHGICMLISLDMVFGYLKDDELVPVNGYVFFKRDQDDEEYETESGLTIKQEVKQYGNLTGTVISADKPVRAYFDDAVEDNTTYKKGDRIIVDKRFGYRMAYDLHGKGFTGIETVYRKHIVCKLLNQQSA